MTRSSHHHLTARRLLLAGGVAFTLAPGTVVGAQDPLPDLQLLAAEPVAPDTRSITQLRHWQVGYFRRGGGALVVTAFDIARDPVFWQFLTGWGTDKDSPAVAAGWAGELSVIARPSDDDSLIRGASATLDGQPKAKWYASMEAPWDSVLVRIDLSAPGDPVALNRVVQRGVLGRAQVVAGPPPQPDQQVQLSDILLYDPDDRQPPTGLTGANGALSRALGSTALMGRRKMGMYWEVYGLPTDEMADASLTVVRLLSHGEARVVVISDAPSVIDAKTIARLRWTVRPPADGGGISTHGVVLDVGSLGIGRHCAVLTITVPGQEPVTVVREFRVEVPAAW